MVNKKYLYTFSIIIPEENKKTETHTAGYLLAENPAASNLVSRKEKNGRGRSRRDMRREKMRVCYNIIFNNRPRERREKERGKERGEGRGRQREQEKEPRCGETERS